MKGHPVYLFIGKEQSMRKVLKTGAIWIQLGLKMASCFQLSEPIHLTIFNLGSAHLDPESQSPKSEKSEPLLVPFSAFSPTTAPPALVLS